MGDSHRAGGQINRPVMWLQKMGPRAEIGSGSRGLSSRREELPARPGPANVTVGRASTLAGFSYPSKDPATLRGEVEWILLLKGAQLRKPQANQRRLHNVPLLTLFSVICAHFLYHHLPIYA